MVSIGSTSLATHTRSQLEFRQRAEQHQHADKTQRPDDRDEFKPSRRSGASVVRLFRADVMHRLTFELSAAFALKFDSLNAYRHGQTPENTAADVLALARQVVEQSNEKPSDALRRVRRSVDEAASASKGMVEMDGEADALAKAESLINRGLDELRKSDLNSASAFEMKARIKQRSTIEIRTQEGDTVRFEIRRTGKMSASNYAAQSGSASVNMTEISISSRSRLVLKIDGDLNSAELEAIQNVFAAAESLANEFFAGDIEAALEIAAGLEIDSAQLARVSMRFKSSERIDASQRVRQFAPAEDVTPAIGAGEEGAGAVAEPAALAPTAGADIVSAAVKSSEPPSSGGFLSGFESLANYLSQLADFLQETALAFNDSIREDSPGTHIRFRMTESIQLEILRVVMNVNAVDHAETHPKPSGNAIQQLAGNLETDPG